MHGHGRARLPGRELNTRAGRGRPRRSRRPPSGPVRGERAARRPATTTCSVIRVRWAYVRVNGAVPAGPATVAGGQVRVVVAACGPTRRVGRGRRPTRRSRRRRSCAAATAATRPAAPASCRRSRRRRDGRRRTTARAGRGARAPTPAGPCPPRTSGAARRGRWSGRPPTTSGEVDGTGVLLVGVAEARPRVDRGPSTKKR